MSTTFTFLTAATPNGHKVAIFLEELRATYGLNFEMKKIALKKGEQKEPWFLKLNPNGAIPVLIDHHRDNFPVFESAAILLYLQEHYDKENKFGFAKDSNEYSEMLQWIFFGHGGLGPIFTQAHHFLRAAPEKIGYAINRYTEEGKRVLGVINSRLAGREWLIGHERGQYTIADMNLLPWFRTSAAFGIESLDPWPNVKAWFERANAKPAFQTAMAFPKQIKPSL